MSTEPTTKPNIGFHSLRESTKEKTIKAEQLNDGYAQKKYRQNSKSQNKETQDVAHGLGKGRMATMLAAEGGVDPTNKENLVKLKKFENDPENLRMKTRHSNRSTDAAFDHAIEKKIERGEKLTKQQEVKEKPNVQYIQSHQDELPAEISNKIEDHVKKEKTQSGNTMWDARKDTKKMREARQGGKKKVK